MAGRKAQKTGVGTMERKTKSSSKTATTAGATDIKKTARAEGLLTASSSVLTYEQIAQRAEAIWHQKGCQPGQDEQNWREAEAQLKAEMGIA